MTERQLTTLARRQCLFSGRVQGVGFRYTVKNLALRYDVAGYVRNLPDGRVELVMEGPEEELDELESAVRERMNGFIHNVESCLCDPTGEYAHFDIRH